MIQKSGKNEKENVIKPSLENTGAHKQNLDSGTHIFESTENSSSSNDDTLILYNDEDYLSCGDVSRYLIKYKALKNDNMKLKQINFKLKNKLDLFLAPVFYLGPYSIYADCRPANYDEFKNFKTDEEIQFNPDIKPFQKWTGILKLNGNSLKTTTAADDDYYYYSWTIDVISQLSLHNSAKIPFSFVISANTENMPYVVPENIKISKLTTSDLWHEPPTVSLENPIHLIVLTHGIFSNIGGDMLFVRDKIQEYCKQKGENVIVRGYEGNMGKSYNGIQSLGESLADYIIELVLVQNKEIHLNKGRPGIKEISFISHSLGGCVQSYAMAHIYDHHPNLFEENGMKLKHFITMASPLLGTAVEMPSYANVVLKFGGLGKTGRDLSLKHKSFFKFTTNDEENKPVLEITARSPIFKKFENRTAYANAIHDGIVPLRTSAILYLDWQSLDKLYTLFKENNLEFHKYNSDNGYDVPIPKLHLNASQKSIETKDLNEENLSTVFYDEHVEQSSNKPKPSPFKKNQKYLRLQTVKNDEHVKNKEDNENDSLAEEIKFQPPPRPSAIIAAANLIFAKLPTQDYIHNLSSRTQDVILHDKVYTPEEIPNAHYKTRPTWKKIFYPNEKKYRKEEKIARYWHQGKDWRKVLVVLKGDAHNDIIVRRRFVNLFGVVAVKHLVENHFGLSD
ncbi:hypothetical protein QEN19_001079 [Hanseniaspora menglaensis]